MSLGLAIFLSTLVISAAMLYHWGHLRFKQPGFNWRKGLKAIGLVAVVFLLAGGAWLGYRYYESRPTAQTQYYDLALGMTMEEVIYVKGEPTNVLEEDNDPNPKYKGWLRMIAVKDLSKEKKQNVNDYLVPGRKPLFLEKIACFNFQQAIHNGCF